MRTKKNAKNIVEIFYENRTVFALSIINRTKVGMDGLIIELACQFCVHPDDNFVIQDQRIYIITGMSNKAWETDLKEKVSACFIENIKHHE